MINFTDGAIIEGKSAAEIGTFPKVPGL